MLMEQNNSQEMQMLKQTEFQKKSQRAFSTIFMAIDTSQLYLVISYDQPKDA